ncbi:MAG: lytic transglycosylase domain-containing protein [Deltaproteobacteria bacterium]|nr:lytic transglycosylase domain-containing protein [Deltaproteobacteria bacterium]
MKRAPGKMRIPLSAALLLISAVMAPMVPDFERGLRLEGSLSPVPGSETVRHAMVKSIRWADDEVIRGWVQKANLKYGRHIDLISAENGISQAEIKAIAVVESLICERAKSGEGAIGLMGIKRGTARDMGFNNIDRPVDNLKAGAKYYRRLVHRFKDRELAMAAYNLGPARLEERLGGGFDPQTMDYIWKIRRVMNIISRSAPGVPVFRERQSMAFNFSTQSKEGIP